MPSPAKATISTVIPGLRYRDAHAAIDWLVRAFGFERHAVYDGPNNTVAHAQLSFGNGMIMLGSATNEGAYAEMMAHPDEIGLRETQHPCLIVADATAVYEMALAANATIVTELAEMPYGGKAFACRDPEGHLWSVGEYDPWAG
ncbi:Uncharacterized conserved protein PhnB, glyoxalase superfamily [Granulicella rosea]|uniref:Uncharacterized conserved protein PhnB, glyoxalase superfamily n=2 Tax=Granulicella rosea TaxID=474952 RepID=A0A239CZW6_9BACT|nr:Uncharacterized conserved protein PhnB, glyoxalase superfamily [Granulicella rosea]